MTGVTGSTQLPPCRGDKESSAQPVTPVTPTRKTAAEELSHALLDLAESGQSTPCQGRRRERWTSDDHGERAWAANVCTSLACPVLAACGAAADEMREKFGTWAGRDRTPHTRKAS